MDRPTGRVLTLLELLQSGGVRTAAELAERLGVDARTVRRYLKHLLDLGIPVESVRGRYGGYRLSRGYRLPPLMLSDDEALAVLMGLITAGTAAGGTSAPGTAGIAAETATAKIRRVLPARLDDRLQALLDSLAFTGPAGAPPPDATVLLTLADAVAHHRPCAVVYTDREGTRTDRILHPSGIVNHNGRWYLRALDPLLGAERTFRLDRIADARTRPGSFEPPAGHDAADRVVSGFATADYRYEVTLRIHGTVDQIRTRLPASIATIQPPAPEGTPANEAAWHRLEIRAETLAWLPPTLAALDLPFEIERPAELHDLVIAFADRLAARARAAGRA